MFTFDNVKTFISEGCDTTYKTNCNTNILTVYPRKNEIAPFWILFNKLSNCVYGKRLYKYLLIPP